MRGAGLIVVGLLAVAFIPPALANPPCNATLLVDTDLTGDLDCSGALGGPLILGADGITVRLHGWTLTCPPGFGNAAGELDVEGILAQGRVGVGVLGPGKITGCGRAVGFVGGSGNVARGLCLTGSLTGINLQGGMGRVARDNVSVANLGTGIGLSHVVAAQIANNWIAANGGDPDPARGFGVSNDNASTAVLRGDHILGNRRGGLAEVGASDLVTRISQSVILGDGGLDLDLRGTNDTLPHVLCETSDPPGLCPHPFPRLR